MSVRFRIRTTAGQEISFASRETFEEFVRSGDLSPDDLVYDRETGSWSSARTHPLVLDIEYEDEDSGSEADDAEGGTDEATDAVAAGDEAGPAPSSHDSSFGLELAPVDERTPEEESQAFVRKLEAERESDLDPVGPSGIGGFKMEDAGSLADMLAPAPPPVRPVPPAPGPPPPAPPRPRPPRPTARREEPAPALRADVPPAAPRKGRGGRLVAGLVVLALASAAGYVGYRSYSEEARATQGEDVDPAPPVRPEPEPTPPPAREPVIASTPAAVRERAQERFLTAARNELRDLQPIPDVWPTGSYLVAPSEHPEVVDVWQAYLTTIRRVRQGDDARYRAAYEAALDDAAVVGDARAERLAAGLAAFSATAPARTAHYDRVESLASAAVQSHRALLDVEGLILYDPAGTTGGRAGLGRGTSARDEQSRSILDQVLEVLSTRLDAGGLGPRQPSRVREWVWDGLLDAVTH